MPGHASLIQLLLTRLERISVDSPLAHRASGVRGSLIRLTESQDRGLPADARELNELVSAALLILRQAAAALRAGDLPRAVHPPEHES